MMTTFRASLLFGIALSFAAPRLAAAESLRFATIEVTVPDTGWRVQTGKRAARLELEAGTAVVELRDMGRAPSARKAALRALTSRGFVITRAKPVTQHGLVGVLLNGTERGAGGEERLFVGFTARVDGRTILATASVTQDITDDALREAAGIVDSLRRPTPAPTPPRAP